MKKAPARWFNLVSGPDSAGRGVTRYYSVTCRACGASAAYHASDLTDDGLRKLFIRRKWEIGRRANQHLCPDCCARRPPPRELEPKAIVAAPVSVADRLCSFCLHDREPAGVIMATSPANACICFDCVRALYRNLSSAPAPEPPPAMQQAISGQDAGNQAANESEAADWWLELNGSRASVNDRTR